MKDKLEAFLAAARDLGVSAVNYIAAEPDRPRPIVSIDAGPRAMAMFVASALGMPEPREVSHNGRRWLSSSVAEPALYLDVRSEPEDATETEPVLEVS